MIKLHVIVGETTVLQYFIIKNLMTWYWDEELQCTVLFSVWDMSPTHKSYWKIVEAPEQIYRLIQEARTVR